MKDFTIKDVVKDFAMDYPLIPIEVLEAIAKAQLNGILKVIKGNKDKVVFRNHCIHTVYRHPNEVVGIFADLDESRQLNKIEERVSKHQRREKKGIYTVRVRGGRVVKRIHTKRLPARAINVGTDTQGSPCNVCRPLHCGPQVQGDSSPAGH